MEKIIESDIEKHISTLEKRKLTYKRKIDSIDIKIQTWKDLIKKERME